MKKCKDRLRNLWDNIKNKTKQNNIVIIGGPEREERERGQKTIQRKNSWKLLKPREGNRHLDPGSQKSFK